MMTIEEEIHQLITFLSHPAGFNVDIGGLLCIRPIDEYSPPIHWEVDWEEYADGMNCKFFKEFHSLETAAQYFVEKRRYLCYGIDFDVLIMKEDVDENADSPQEASETPSAQ